MSYIWAGLSGNGEDLEGGRAGPEADLLLLSPHLGEGGAHPDGGGRTDHLQDPDGGMHKQGIIHKNMRIYLYFINRRGGNEKGEGGGQTQRESVDARDGHITLEVSPW